jgi:hypothetical protein
MIRLREGRMRGIALKRYKLDQRYTEKAQRRDKADPEAEDSF